MLDQNADKALDRAEYHAVNHDWAVLLSVRSHILQLKPLGQLEVQLNRSALPGTSDAVHQMEVNLRAVEGSVSLVDDIGKTQLVQSSLKGRGRHLPVLVASHGILGTGGQLHMVLEAEQGIGIIDQSYHALDLILDLLRRHENMRIVLGEAAHTHQAMQLAGFLVTVHQAKLTHADGQIPVGTGLGSVHQHAARAVHRLDREVLAVDHRRVHIVFIVIPVAGGLPEAAVQDHRRGNLHIAGFLVNLSPVIKKRVFQHHSLGQEERKSRSGLMHHKESQLFSQLSVVALLSLLHHGDVGLQLLLLREGRRIETGQHLIVLVAAPVGSRQAHDFEGLSYLLRALQMRSRAEIHELALLIEADLLALRQILDKLHLIGLALFLHEGDRLVPGLREAHDFQVLLDDLLHLRLDLFKIVRGKRRLKVHVVVEAVRDGGADGQLDARIQTLHRLGHHMAGRMAQHR